MLEFGVMTDTEKPTALEQAEKFRALQQEIEKGVQDVRAGRVREWDLADFLRRARAARSER
jgi:hypothetical protein